MCRRPDFPARSLLEGSAGKKNPLHPMSPMLLQHEVHGHEESIMRGFSAFPQGHSLCCHLLRTLHVGPEEDGAWEGVKRQKFCSCNLGARSRSFLPKAISPP